MKIRYIVLLTFIFTFPYMRSSGIEVYGDSIFLSTSSTLNGKFQWQFSKDSVNWINIEGANKKEYKHRVVESGYFRVRIQDKCEYFSKNQYVEVWKRDFYMNINKGLINQGLVCNDGRLYVSNDINGVYSKIVVYDWLSKLALKEIPNLPIGHGAELDYQKSTKIMFATNGGGTNPCKVYTLNIEDAQPTIQKTYNLSQLGNSSIIALDDENNIFYILSTLSGGDYGNTTITPVDIRTGIPDLSRQFTLPFIGVPQGAKFKKGKIYFLMGVNSTIITVIDPIQKKLIEKIVFPNTSEPEGLGIIDDVLSNKFKFVVGYANDTVYVISF